MRLNWSDVGGGSVPNDTRHNLARIPLRWMIRQCFICETGILFYKDLFERIGLNPNTLYPVVLPRPPPINYTPDCFAHKCDLPVNFATHYKRTIKLENPVVFKSEEEEDLFDALTPIYDQLRMKKGWWLLEFLPYRHVYQKPDDSWSKSRRYIAQFSFKFNVKYLNLFSPGRLALTGVTLARSPDSPQSQSSRSIGQ